MKEIYIELDGKQLPCRPTMGAMLRFKRETGKEVTEIGTGDISLLATYMWCCVVSGCNREGRKFEYTLEDFADNVTPDVVSAWSAATSGAEAGTGEKKSN